MFSEQNRDPVPFPAISDAFYLASYLGFIFAVVQLATAGRRSVLLWLDGGVLALALATAASPLALTSSLGISGGPLETFVGMAYPGLDLIILLLLVAGIFANGGRVSPAQAVMALGTAFYAGGDIVYLDLLSRDGYVPGTLLDGTWAIGVLLFATSTCVDSAARDGASAVRRPFVTFLPVLAATVALAIPALSVAVEVPRVSVGLAVAALAMVLLRLTLALGERDRLLHSHSQARTDDLTGLLNRRGFLEALDTTMAEPMTRCTVLMFDLDGFKNVNDTHGHESGDRVLAGVAHAIASRLPADLPIARLGGDEFAVLLAVNHELSALAVARELVTAVHGACENLHLHGLVSASCGIALSPQHATESTSLLRCADLAMYRAKELGGDRAEVFDSSVDVGIRQSQASTLIDR